MHGTGSRRYNISVSFVLVYVRNEGGLRRRPGLPALPACSLMSGHCEVVTTAVFLVVTTSYVRSRGQLITSIIGLLRAWSVMLLLYCCTINNVLIIVQMSKRPSSLFFVALYKACCQKYVLGVQCTDSFSGIHGTTLLLCSIQHQYA